MLLVSPLPHAQKNSQKLNPKNCYRKLWLYCKYSDVTMMKYKFIHKEDGDFVLTHAKKMCMDKIIIINIIWIVNKGTRQGTKILEREMERECQIIVWLCNVECSSFPIINFFSRPRTRTTGYYVVLYVMWWCYVLVCIVLTRK